MPVDLADAPPTTGAAVVVGDVMLDIRTQLTADDLASALALESMVPGRISLTLAGTGVNMARALVEQFGTVHLIGAVGSDTGGLLARKLLDSEPYLSRVIEADGGSGMALVLRDAPQPGDPHGRRIVVADRGANEALDLSLMAAGEDVLMAAALLCVDAYGLLHEPRRAATTYAMGRAAEVGCVVFCDLVPHDLDRHVTVDQCRSWLADATVVGTSIVTLDRLLGRRDPSSALDDRQVLDLARRGSESLDVETLLVRYGYGHCSWSLACHRDQGVLWREPTAYPHLDADQLAGFGDHLSAQELRRLCEIAR